LSDGTKKILEKKGIKKSQMDQKLGLTSVKIPKNQRKQFVFIERVKGTS